jgi:hypothetical protein
MNRTETIMVTIAAGILVGLFMIAGLWGFGNHGRYLFDVSLKDGVVFVYRMNTASGEVQLFVTDLKGKYEAGKPREMQVIASLPPVLQ